MTWCFEVVEEYEEEWVGRQVFAQLIPAMVEWEVGKVLGRQTLGGQGLGQVVPRQEWR